METPAWLNTLPTVNASLNGLAAILLAAGYVLIRRGHVAGHKRIMLLAFAVSILVLVFYLAYHFALHHYTGEGSKHFSGTGTVRVLYFAILISHVILAASVPVLASMTIYRALKAEAESEDPSTSALWERHRRIARITFPIWLYVSVTGVIIYGMLYHWI